ncbi:MAG: class I SAM-dependent methyltransferase [Chloroflexota bacterium]|nr:class I SAM-dependent methyltransferase [Chloroflexota bacterium]
MATAHPELRQRLGDYGFDGSVAGLCAMAAGGVALAGLTCSGARAGRRVLPAIELVSSLTLLGTVAIYVHATRHGKFAVWAGLLESLPLHGDERVLDMGCGRGAVMTIVAKLVPQGRVVGLDLWTADQSGNSPEATRRNLEAEGVIDRCQVMTGNMTAMPLPDASFDLVVSSMAIHNIDQFRRSKQGCLQAVNEAVRVLKPGGRLMITDLGLTPLYARRMRDLGMDDVQQRTLDWRFWYGPWIGARLVTATKPRSQ